MPDDTTAPDRRARQERALMVFAGVLVLLLGLGTTVASLWRMVHFTDHRRALLAAGTPMMATVADQRHFHTFKTDRDDFRLVYDYGGRHVDVTSRWVGVLNFGIFALFGVGLTGVGILLLVAGSQSGRRPVPAVRDVPPRRDGKRLGRRPARRPRRR